MDMAASVLAKLKIKADKTGRPFQLYLQLFCQEEFLRKVSLSKYKDNLILKGGLFIFTLTNFESRATMDVDFLLRRLPNSVQDIKKVIEGILTIDTGNNYITMTADGYSEITPQRKYKGVSVQIKALIKNTKTPFNVDFGIGDVIIPKPEQLTIKTQLEDFAAPQVTAYSLESTISEKFDAMISRLELTGRMKDYYDIYYLANRYSFDGLKLLTACKETLQNRGTAFEKNSFERIIGFSDNNDMQKKWGFFLRKLGYKTPEFITVLNELNKFLSPIWQSIINESEFFGTWDNEKSDWRKNNPQPSDP